MREMIKKLNLCASILLLTLLLLSPTGSVFSQEPSEPREENTLGEGLKAIKEAEGRVDPEAQGSEENQLESATDPEVKPQDQAQIQDMTEEPAQEAANNDETGILKLPEDADEDSLPRGEDLRATEEPRYSSAGLRDPFKPFLKLVNVPVGPEPILRPPLRRYPLSSFRLAGIIWVGDQPKAMIVDPEENTYFLGVGDRIGNKEGEILEVRERGILVQEQTRFENVYGEVKTEVKKSVLAF